MKVVCQPPTTGYAGDQLHMHYIVSHVADHIIVKDPYTHTPIHPYTHTPIHPYIHTPIHPYIRISCG